MDYLYEKSTKLVLMKCQNLNAERCLVKLKDKYEIIYLVDPYYHNQVGHRREYKGVEIVSFDELWQKCIPSNTKFLLFENEKDKLKGLIKLLSSKGLRLFDDYVWWEDFISPYHIRFFDEIERFGSDFISSFKRIGLLSSRKIAIVNGNCQVAILKKYLLANPYFRNIYCLVDFPEICNYIEGNYETEIIENADLIITQIISESNRHNRYLSCSYIDNHKSDQAIVVKISPLYFQGYFPQHSSDCKSEVLGNKLIVYGDENINKMHSQGIDVLEIKKRLNSYDFYDYDYLHEYFCQQLDIFKNKDKCADVKMWDYLYRNVWDDIIFYSFNHPKNHVIYEQAKRILNYLGIYDDYFENEEEINSYNGMYTQEEAVYPCVYKFLGLECKNDKRIYPNRLASDFSFLFDDYIDFYINAIE